MAYMSQQPGGMAPGPAPVPIETAAGTTSPDNARSGSKAYVIAAVTVVLLMVFGLGMSGCMRLMASFVDEKIQTVDYDYRDMGIEDWEDDLENQWDFYDDVDGTGQETGSYTVREVLESDLVLYSVTLDSLIPASSYANTQKEVSTFVRDVAVCDRDASTQLSELLRTAVWGEDGVSDALAQAIELSDSTIEGIRAIELPEATGEHASSVSRDLESGRSKAVKRWEAVKAELELLSGSDEVDASKLLDAEDDLAAISTEAADELVSALQASAAR